MNVLYLLLFIFFSHIGLILIKFFRFFFLDWDLSRKMKLDSIKTTFFKMYIKKVYIRSYYNMNYVF